MQLPFRSSIAALSVCVAVLTLLSLRVADQKSTGQAEPKAKSAESPKQDKPSAALARFQEEWKEVRIKYPSVAAAYLESLEYVIDSNSVPMRAAQRQQFDLLGEHLRLLGFPLRCRWVCEPDDERPPPPPLCPTCLPARNPEDIERYLECLERRIECLH